jgi:poly-beta-1,6-N-acetyl-D-glucosamine synthase
VKLLFWFSVLFVFYTYLLYPMWLFLRARLYPRPVHRTSFFPKVTIILTVRNEAHHFEEKLHNLQQLDYPRELLEVVVVSDGSTDRTNEILLNWGDPSLHSIFLPAHVGKAEALNRAIEGAKGDVIVFMDARQRVACDSVKILAENFADRSVGCASGALVLEDGALSSPRGVRSYWNLEKAIRHCESSSGSAVGCTGALYAARRSLLPRLPAGLILDDVFIPMEASRLEARVIFDERALVWDQLPSSPRQEFRRKVRTLFGNYQLVCLSPWLLTSANGLRFEFISHKLCRLVVPFALIAMILASAMLSGFVYRLPLLLATGVIALGALSFARVPRGISSRVADLAFAVLLLNVAAIVAFLYFSAGKKRVWVA